MTKRQLVKFLEAKQEEAMKNARNAYEEAKQKHKLQVESDIKIDVVAKKIAMLISQADDILDEWMQYINEHSELEIEIVNYSHCLKWKLNDLITASSIKGYMRRHIHDASKHKSQLENIYNQMTSGVTSNYANVISNIQQLKDAKLGVQYLTELGFDMTALLEEDKRQVTTALSVAVDTSFLFIQEVESNEGQEK